MPADQLSPYPYVPWATIRRHAIPKLATAGIDVQEVSWDAVCDALHQADDPGPAQEPDGLPICPMPPTTKPMRPQAPRGTDMAREYPFTRNPLLSAGEMAELLERVCLWDTPSRTQLSVFLPNHGDRWTGSGFAGFDASPALMALLGTRAIYSVGSGKRPATTTTLNSCVELMARTTSISSTRPSSAHVYSAA